MKKILTVLFFITLALSSQNLVLAQQLFGGGDGSVGNPYLITRADTLKALADSVNNGIQYDGVYFTQTADIDLNVSPYNTGTGWTPIGIGTSGKVFKGNYDGAGFKVKNLMINDGATINQGLFGYVWGGTISNLGVEGVNIAGGAFIGGLTGVAGPGCNISNCYSTGSVYGAGSGTNGIVGGLIGSGFDFSAISNCYSSATVAISGANVYSAGGFMGHISADNALTYTITNCYCTGTVTADAIFNHIGAFLGDSTTNGGGTLTFSNCFWNNQTAGMAIHGIGNGSGGYEISDVTGETTANMKTQSTFTGWDFTPTTGVWEIIAGFYPRLQSVPDGTLPVELTSFTSAVSKNGVTLKWSTATEVNNYGFNVERRAVTSASNWAKVGFVAGHGTSNSTISYSYSDAGLASGRYAYRLKQIDNGGAFKYSQSIEVEAVSLAPAKIGLSQNYPNPFNPSTLITFSVANTEQTKLIVFNILGQPVVTLFDGVANGQQTYQLRLDASKLSSGVYFYKLESPSRTEVRRMQLLK